MSIAAKKDIGFVSIQLLLFIFYFIPFVPLSFSLPIFFSTFGILMAAFGILFILVAIFQLNKNLTPFPTPVEGSTLIQNGIYRHIRHPIYSGIILAALGFGLSQSSLWQIGIGIILWVLFYFKSKYEEIMLSRHFPEYAAYMAKTGRFFPFF